MENFGTLLKELREATDLTQQELAKALDINVRSIQRYERGNCQPDMYVVKKVADYFNVSSDYLMGLKPYAKRLEEKKRKLKGIEGYNPLYGRYLKCLSKREYTEGATYYWIWMDGKKMGGITMWKGWQDAERRIEIRQLRPVNPVGVVEHCEKLFGKMMILNSAQDVTIFMLYGGQAIVRKDICEAYLPEFCEDYICEKTDSFYFC